MTRSFTCLIVPGLLCLAVSLDLSTANAAKPPIGVGLYGRSRQQFTAAPLPLTLEEELHPLRMLLRAKDQLRAAVR